MQNIWPIYLGFIELLKPPNTSFLRDEVIQEHMLKFSYFQIRDFCLLSHWFDVRVLKKGYLCSAHAPIRETGFVAQSFVLKRVLIVNWNMKSLASSSTSFHFVTFRLSPREPPLVAPAPFVPAVTAGTSAALLLEILRLLQKLLAGKRHPQPHL